MEIGRKYGSRASDSVRHAASNVSERVSKSTSEMRSGSRPNTSALSQRAGDVTRRIGSNLDRGLNYTQRRLEQSDTAVIAFTLILMVACIVLTALAVWVWYKY
jgi:cobalamin biosynthesis Mg chelatase CobN